jgi:L-fucose isomerase-like protein
MKKPRVGCYAVYEPPEEGWENWQVQFQAINVALESCGLEVIAAPEAVSDLASCERVSAWAQAQHLDLLHALVITWSFDHYTLEIQQATGLPVAVRSIPGIRTGSLVGGTQLGNVLADLEREYRLFFGPLEGELAQMVAGQTATYAKACMVANHLKGARLAVIGRRTEGMTPTAVDEVEIMRIFGVRLLNFGLDELLERAALVDLGQAEAQWKQIASGARQVISRTEHGVATARNYLALKQMVAEMKLNAITIGSYPKCQGTMCVPIAWLNEDSLPTGCEGDVNSTLAMLILSLFSDLPVHFGEMLEVDEVRNTLVTSHCGCGSPSLADAGGYVLCPVRLANNGVAIRFTARSGPITFVNLVGRKGNYRMCAFEGQAVPTEMVFEGNPLRFELRTPFRRVWQQVAAGGFGHHWMTAYAQAAPVLQEFCKIKGITGIFPDL